MKKFDISEMKKSEEKSDSELEQQDHYIPRFSVIVKSGNFSRGYVIRAIDSIDMLRQLSERASLPNNAEIIYSEILVDSDIIDDEDASLKSRTTPATSVDVMY